MMSFKACSEGLKYCVVAVQATVWALDQSVDLGDWQLEEGAIPSLH